MKEIRKTKMLGIALSQVTLKEVLEFIYISLQKKEKKLFVVTPNIEILMFSRKNPDYQDVINRTDLALPDSIGLFFAAKILGVSLKERIPGVDLLENICRQVSKRPITVGFLGGGPGVALSTAECLSKKYPSLKISFAIEEWPASEDKIKPKSDILFVAFGSPKQELWIAKNLPKIDVRVAIGVGGSFDFISGKVPRAPKFVRNLGLEWLFRLVIQPWRIKRQLAIPAFLLLVFKEKLKKNLKML